MFSFTSDRNSLFKLARDKQKLKSPALSGAINVFNSFCYSISPKVLSIKCLHTFVNFTSKTTVQNSAYTPFFRAWYFSSFSIKSGSILKTSSEKEKKKLSKHIKRHFFKKITDYKLKSFVMNSTPHNALPIFPYFLNALNPPEASVLVQQPKSNWDNLGLETPLPGSHVSGCALILCNASVYIY